MESLKWQTRLDEMDAHAMESDLRAERYKAAIIRFLARVDDPTSGCPACEMKALRLFRNIANE